MNSALPTAVSADILSNDLKCTYSIASSLVVVVVVVVVIAQQLFSYRQDHNSKQQNGMFASVAIQTCRFV